MAASFSPAMFPTRLRRPRFNLTAGGSFAPASAPAPTATMAPRASAAPMAGAQPTAAPPGLPSVGQGVWDRFQAQNPFNAQGAINGQLREGQSLGAFSPYFMRDQLRAGALRNADAQRRRNAIFAHLQGLDPAQARAAMVEAENHANAGVAGSLNDAESEGLRSYRDYILSLLQGERQHQSDWAMAREARKQSRGAAWGQGIGAIAGAIL